EPDLREQIGDRPPILQRVIVARPDRKPHADVERRVAPADQLRLVLAKGLGDLGLELGPVAVAADDQPLVRAALGVAELDARGLDRGDHSEGLRLGDHVPALGARLAAGDQLAALAQALEARADRRLAGPALAPELLARG